MTEKTIKRIHLIYGLVLSCLILVTGACLIAACLSIYKIGDSPYSRESVANAFGRIAIPVFLCLAGIVGGIVLTLALPLPSKKSRAILDSRDTLSRLCSRLDETAIDVDLQKRILSERKLRKLLKVIGIAVGAVCTILAGLYACDPDNYTLENLNGDILTAALVALGFFALAFAVCFLFETLCRASVARELEVVKEALKVAPKKESTKNVLKKRDTRLLWAIRGTILLVGIVFVIVGILNGGAEDVLGKAIRICTECIGLG